MTSKLTRERLEKIKSWRETYGAGSNVMLPAEEAEELARMALAALDGEPDCKERNLFCSTDTARMRKVISVSAGTGGAPLYRHAQPAPVVTFYRDGIEASAKWIDQQREAYDSEHGWSDPDTGTFEFGNDAQRGYSSTLEELAEGIRALHPNAGNSPAIPDGYVMVPVKPTMEILDEFDSIIDYGAEDSEVAWRRLLAAAPQEGK